MSNGLTDKVAVISGGSRGIGRAIALQLAKEGVDCILASHNKENLTAAAHLIRDESGRRIEICAADLRTLEGCQAVQGMVQEGFGRVDILVNCAGATQGGPFLELEDRVWEDGFALKFYACVRLSRLLWPLLKENHSNVINIIGGFARNPAPDFMIGGAVNAAMANFSKALSKLGLQDDENVNAIHPGLTVTERLGEIFSMRAQQSGMSVEQIKESSVKNEGLRRLGEPEDVAHLVAFLCSPHARHIQGTAIAVDGGGTSGVF